MLISLVGYAEKPPTPPQYITPPPGLPIDGGLSFLLISGVAYGIFELKRKKFSRIPFFVLQFMFIYFLLKFFYMKFKPYRKLLPYNPTLKEKAREEGFCKS